MNHEYKVSTHVPSMCDSTIKFDPIQFQGEWSLNPQTVFNALAKIQFKRRYNETTLMAMSQEMFRGLKSCKNSIFKKTKA